MAMQELDLLGNFDLSDEEKRALAETSHSALLAETFKALTDELDAHGNTDQFAKLRTDHARKLILYWKNKVAIYKQALSEKVITPGATLIRGEENLVISQYNNDDVILMISRKTSLEEDEVRISVSSRGEISQYVDPPTIKSKIKTDPDEVYDMSYKVTFATDRYLPGNSFMISSFEREKVYEDPEHQRPWVYDTRVIK